MAQFHPGTTTDPTQSAMAKTSPATVVTPRARVIQRLLWTSLALTIMTFAVSMVFFGFMSMFISLAGVGCCLILDITLLALSAKERRLAAQSSAATVPGARPNSYPPSNIPSAKGPLPCTLRKPSIIFALFFVVVWGGALAMVIYFLVYWEALEQENNALIAAPILEAIFIGTHIAVLLTFAVLAWKERVKGIAGGNELKWWQLGDYNV